MNRESLPDFQSVLDDSPFGVFLADAHGYASYANAACGDITGLAPQELLGHGWTLAVDPADRRRVFTSWQDACDAGQSLDLSCRFVAADGARRYVRIRCRRVAASDGNSVEHMGVLFDMTEQVLAERRLRRNNELLGTILENIPCGVTVYDADGSLVLDNQKFRSILRLPENAAEGVVTDFGTLAIGPQAQAFPDSADSRRRAAGAAPPPRVREELQPDGRVFEVRDAPMPTGGTVTTYMDISQHKGNIERLQRAKAAAEQAAAAKAAFLATMSHEIRTPMNGVMGMTDILLNMGLTADQHEIVEVIRQSGESLLVVLNDILDYSRIESGQMELEWQPLRLQEVVDHSVRLLAPKAHEKGVALAVEIDPTLPALILGDRTRLQQVLVNLISNAVKFTDHGRVAVALKNFPAAAGPKRGGGTGDLYEILVCIQDSGIGIPREKLQSIFDPFVQGDSSTARRFGGTGLGLAIAKRLVVAMGGSIEISSEVGAGTEVVFSFMAETPVPSARSGASGHALLWGKRVLLVRGSRSDTGVLSTQLSRWGIDVQTCTSSPAALSQLAGTERFDLVVTAAHHLSGPRGLNFVRRLRDAGVAVPVLLLSRDETRASEDPDLSAWTLPRSASECELYDALVAMLHGERAPQLAGHETKSHFDYTLGHVAPLRILVAEDNEINRKVILRMLAGFGYEADVAHDGAQAIDAVQEAKYDVVLMDVQMPVVDGIEATRFIIENIPPERRPRIVAMSASVMPEHVDVARAAGADQYIAKPFAPSELRAALEQSALRRAPPAAQGAEQVIPSQVLSLERIRWHLETDGDGKFLRELTHSFRLNSEELLSRLEAAAAAGDHPGVRSLAHEFSGVCAVLGAEKLTSVLVALQKIVRAGSDKGAVLLLAQCRTVRDQTVAALEAVVSQHAARSSTAARPAGGPSDASTKLRRPVQSAS
jgi:PAS domain S-box-containing protein